MMEAGDLFGLLVVGVVDPVVVWQLIAVVGALPCGLRMEWWCLVGVVPGR